MERDGDSQIECVGELTKSALQNSEMEHSAGTPTGA